MKVGLIARANEKGLGQQTLSAYHGYPFHSVLLVLDHNRRAPEYPEWYPGARQVVFDPSTHRLEPMSEVVAYLDGLDAIFSVETLYDWQLAAVCRSKGVRTIVQGNPEFYRHHKTPFPHPDIWTWPTDWMLDRLPPGPVVPVPVPTDCWAKPGGDDDPLTVVHVGGHRANGDRNGTDLFVQSLRFIDGNPPVNVRIYSQDGWLPELPRLNKGVEVESYPRGALDKWAMYEGAHLLVLPRRYGGLSLPVNEAMNVGLAVILPDVSPNRGAWPSAYLLPPGNGRTIQTPLGQIKTAVLGARIIGQGIQKFALKRDMLVQRMYQSQRWAAENSWSVLSREYDKLFASDPIDYSNVERHEDPPVSDRDPVRAAYPGRLAPPARRDPRPGVPRARRRGP